MDRARAGVAMQTALWCVGMGLVLQLAGCAAAKTDAATADAGVVDSLGADALDGTASDAVQDAATVGGKGTAFPACDPTAKTQRVSFVHVNDLHANYQLGPDGISPVSRIRGYVNQVRAENPYTLFTNGGDDYEKGSVADQLSQGKSTTAILHALEFDVRVIGNHDYAWSEHTVLENASDPYAHVLSSNIHYTGTDPLGFGAVDFVKMQVGCVTIGFAGFTSKPWDSTDSQIDADFYPTFPASYQYIEHAKEIVDAHRKEVDVLVFINHIGIGEDKDLVKAVPGIDAVLSGHSHTFTPVPEYNGTSAPVVQSGSYAAHVVRLDLDVDLTSRQVKNIAFGAADPGMGGGLPVATSLESFIEYTLSQFAPEADKGIGQFAGIHGPDDAALIGAQACKAVTGADAALMDVGTAWSVFLPGPASQQMFVKMFTVEREPAGTPGFNSAYTAQITGAELQKLAALTSGWAYVGPETIDPAKSYTLCLQKRPALNPTHVPGGAVVTQPVAQMEMWQVLDKYARLRTAACKYMDSDDALSPCP